MRSGLLTVSIVLLATPARADNALEAHAHAEEQKTWLELDPLPIRDPDIAGVGATQQQTERTTVDLSPRTQVTAFSTIWSNTDGALPALDSPARGWHAGIRYGHDFGWAQLVISGTVSEVDSQLGGRGRYVDVGLWFGRRFKLSRWMTAWIALTLGERVWLGQAPADERPSKQVGLSIGTTFR